MNFFSFSTAPEFIEALRLSMNYGYVRYAGIIAWADKFIRRVDVPEKILLDISTCNDARDLDYTLNSHVKVKSVYSARIVLGFLNQKLTDNELTEQEVAQQLYAISLVGIQSNHATDASIYLSPVESQLIYPFDDSFYLVEAGIIGGLQEFKSSLRELMGVYSRYRLDNFDEWKSIHQEADKELKKYSNKYHGSAFWEANSGT